MFLHENADLSTVRRVAVLPFENLTTDRFASERVRQIFVVELLSQGAFDVVETGEVNRVLRAQNVENIATDFYAAYSRINNRNGAGYTVGNAASRGAGSSAVNVGMRHAF